MRRSTERILTTHGGRLPDPSTVGAFQQARGHVRKIEGNQEGVRMVFHGTAKPYGNRENL